MYSHKNQKNLEVEGIFLYNHKSIINTSERINTGFYQSEIYKRTNRRDPDRIGISVCFIYFWDNGDLFRDVLVAGSAHIYALRDICRTACRDYRYAKSRALYRNAHLTVYDKYQIFFYVDCVITESW